MNGAGEQDAPKGRRGAGAGWRIEQVRPAGDEHQVVTVSRASDEGGRSYRRKPCADCPWRRDAVGKFPAEAFRHSAETAYDLSEHVFSCHASGIRKPAVCAGFLLRGAYHNLSVRLGYIKGHFADDVSDAGLELFDGYREMAIANGVDPDDPVLALCRD
ncbi:DUF6283 family protein [Geopseudomonas aromaticivorans]